MLSCTALITVFVCLCFSACEGKSKKNNEIIPVLTPGIIPTEEPSAPSAEPCTPTEEPVTPSPVPATPVPVPADDELVLIKDYIPDIFVDLKYASEDNFTGKTIYDFTEPRLRYGTVRKLSEVQEEMKALGLCLKIWDAYRPKEAQFRLWEICPDPTYVSDPNKGFSNHSRGNTVDVTVVRLDGSEIEMPSGFDDFSEKANRDYSDVSADARKNILVLEKAMSEHGFNCYFGEWWHYNDTTVYPVVE